MPLREFLAIIRRRWVSIVVFTFICMCGAALASFVATPMYRASAQVFFTLPYGNTAGELSQGAAYTQNEILTYAQMATTPIVLNPASKDVGHGLTGTKLVGKVSASATTNTVILTITATDASPALAREIANSVAARLGDAASELAPRAANGKSTVQARTVGSARLPTAPYSPAKIRNLALALLGGVFFGVAIAVLRELLDTRISTRRDLEIVTNAPILGEIPEDASFSRDHLVLRDNPAGVLGESFRRVATNMTFLAVDRKPMAAVITSTMPNEGKSSIAINLAFASAEAGARTLLVDADLRSPSVAGYMGLEGSAGLANVLVGQASFDEVVQHYRAEIPLDVLTSGPRPPNAGPLLASDAMGALLLEIFGRYDAILIDCAPLLAVTDAAVLAREMSGAIVVTRVSRFGRIPGVKRRGLATRGQLTEALGSLTQLHADVLGIVLNGISRRGGASYGYGSDEPRPSRWRRVRGGSSPVEQRPDERASARHRHVDDVPGDSESDEVGGELRERAEAKR